MNKCKIKGYSLIEILLVVGMFALLAILVFPSALQDNGNAKLLSTIKQLESSTYVSQQNAYSRLNNTSYGIAFYVNKYTIFTGTSVASASAKEDINIPNNMTISQISLNGGGNELVFSPGSFKPNKTGEILLKDNFSTYKLDINAEGLIQSFKL